MFIGQPVDEIEVEILIVFGGIQSHECLVGGRDVLGVMSNCDPINMKFGMEVEYNELNNYPKFGCDELISCPIRARTKKFSQRFSLVPAIIVDVIVP